MASNLTFTLGGLSCSLCPRKVDRSRLYGHNELRALTDNGDTCLQAAINGDGTNIICPGATKIGITDAEGRWVERAVLVPALVDGVTPVRIPSSFEGEIVLDRECTAEDLLNLTINAIYQLTGDEAAMLTSLIGNRIYNFPFSYRSGFEASEAFLLSNDSGLFMITGTLMHYEFLTLEEVGAIEETEGDEMMEDELDFSMM